ncbi:MAG: 3-phosphoserine/phosphohydroxythreonine transaminase [Armatimonadetes bacterium]|nr:3-phosphoserine/phosphohydroxythreonine transaminase [Armatimonadota bacterium]
MAIATKRVFNFSAGPGVLPVPVLEKARDGMLDWNGSGMGVMEMSHRGKTFLQIAEQTEADFRTLCSISDDYRVLFLQGGASLQFTMLAQNFLHGGTADYIVTGTWGEKAVQAAALEGQANVVWTGKASNYNTVPNLGDLSYSPGRAYTHITTNETIQGVDFLADPKLEGDVICDMSSCIASRPFDMSRYAMVYAGAQKNLGPAGCTIVVLRKDMLERVPSGLPPMLDYKVQADNDSMYNTPPTWSMYVCGLVFRHWLDFGGLEAVARNNEAKAKVVYDAIDGSGGFYKGHAERHCQSRMNIAFTLADDSLTDSFVAEAKAEGMLELKGHRSVGGCRASTYNAFPIEGCQALASFMAQFAKKNG